MMDQNLPILIVGVLIATGYSIALCRLTLVTITILPYSVNIMLNLGRLRRCRNILPRRTFSTSSAEASAKSKTPSKTNVAGIAVFGSICLGTFGLGCWQLQRNNWKVDLMDEAKKRYLMDAQVIGDRKFSQSEMYDSLQDISGQRLALKGTFDHDNEVRIGPRAAPPGLVTDAAQGMATNPQGFFVITPVSKLAIPCLLTRGGLNRFQSNDTIFATILEKHIRFDTFASLELTALINS